MRGELLAFDLETTGLNPATDEIIEVGIARFREGELIDEFQSLVKPSIPIPADITHLTGIHPEDVEDAPPIDALIEPLERFFGAAPVIAHNVGFDVAFMRKHGLLAANPAIDTLELAAIALPSAPRYSLGNLAARLGINLARSHRAFDDARATGHLYWKLWLTLRQLPAAVLSEIIQASGGKEWALRPVFQAALQDNLRADVTTGAVQPFVAERLTAPPLDIAEARRDRLAADHVDEVFRQNGKLDRALDSYEAREQQLTMAHEVANALNQGDQVMIEAGTGTGKSLAYLLPAALWALQNGQRVTVATNTINLQEQLLKHDYPLVQKIVGDKLQAALMKGRGNYLCPRRLETMRRRKPANLEELRTFAKILVWLQNGASGDRGEITLRAGEWACWSRLSAQDEGCTTFRCASEMAGACPYYRARQRAETAHILITNHALLIADAKIENRALPTYYNLVVDEAHHLEDAITDGMSRRIDQALLLNRLRDLGDTKRGTLGAFLAAAKRQLPQQAASRLETFIKNISDTVELMKAHIRQYFRAWHDFAGGNNSAGRYARRFTRAQRESGAFGPVQSAWKLLASYFLAVTDAMGRLQEALPRYEHHQIPDFNDYRSEIRAHWRFLAELHEQIEHFTHEPEANSVYAVTAGDSAERVQLRVSPLHIGPLMEEYLNQRMESIILTSATLRTQGSFGHISERLYTDNFNTIALGSPFNYRKSTMLFVPSDLPEPGRRSSYQKMLERGLIELAAALDGRMMVLFTSYAQLRETSKAITPRLTLGDIMVYDQSFGTSREILLESFKSADKAVLMGTRSFWEGVDIPGDDLSALVIAKLPFAVPSDPVFSARAEQYSNSFQQYAVPDAILRFRQGFGRLIRSRTDRGVVAIFDSRIINKPYGASFLESLPECAVEYGLLESLPRIAKAWIDGA